MSCTRKSLARTELLSKSVVTPSDVEDQARLALDLRDMKELLANQDFVNARQLYVTGRNSNLYDKEGNDLHQKRSLKQLSFNATYGFYDEDPTFLFHTYGLSALSTSPSKKAGKEELMIHYTYAHDFVGELLADVASGTLAVEAIVALNLWMYVAHELWQSVSECAYSTLNRMDGSTLENVNAKGAQSFDEAIAYWIGEGQSNGDTDGYALYNLAQTAGDAFDTIDTEAYANSKIKRLYEEGRALLSFEAACTEDSNTLEQLWHVTNEMVSQMMIPLVQMLILSMKERDYHRIQIYAIAIVPQISACKPSIYRYLKSELIQQTYKSSSFDKILEELQNSFSCLGLSCEDIGAYGEAVPMCQNKPFNSPLAGYTPTGSTESYSKIDLDISQLQILSLLQSYDMAFLLYEFGKNSYQSDLETYTSLQSLATTPSRRKVVPWFLEFEEYFDDQNYAHTEIVNHLLSNGKWGKRSADQRAAFITAIAQYHIMYMAPMTCMSMAMESCNDRDIDTSIVMWDRLAAYLIGSIEGSEEGGADPQDGKLIWNLANSLCTQFGTCNRKGISAINADFEDLLYAGKAELNSLDCTKFGQTVNKLEHIMLIPIIQGVLRFAIKNEHHSDISPKADLATGEALALSILPIAKYHNPVSAEFIENNMIIKSGLKPVASGAVSVGDAFAPILDKFGLKCDYVGSFGDVDACPGKSNFSSGTRIRFHGSKFIFSLICFCFWIFQTF